MNRFILVLFLCALSKLYCIANDNTLSHGVPGSYSRWMSLYGERVVLKKDGTYIFTVVHCLGDETLRGTWSLLKRVVILTPTKNADLAVHAKRLIVVVAKDDLALRPLSDSDDEQAEDDSEPLFLADKEEANQAVQRTRFARR